MSGEQKDFVAKFKNWFTEINHQPSVADRIRHGGVDLLLSLATLQVGRIAMQSADSYAKDAKVLLAQSESVFNAVQLLETTKHLMWMNEVMDGVFYGAMAVGMLSMLQLAYNATMVVVEITKDPPKTK